MRRKKEIGIVQSLAGETQVQCSRVQKTRREMAQYEAREVGRQRFNSVKDFSLDSRSSENL